MCAPDPAGNVEAVVALFDALFLEAAMPLPFRADRAGGADVRKPYSTCRTLSESIPEHRSERICGRAAGISAAPSGKPRCRMRAPKARRGLTGQIRTQRTCNVTPRAASSGHLLRDQCPKC